MILVKNLILPLTILGVYDLFFSRFFIGRWFNIHFFANAIITLLATTPTALLNDNVVNVVDVASAVHLYHALFFKLKGHDLFHHALFVPMLSLVGNWYYPTNQRLVKNTALFICGLPGMVTYFLLVLKKNGLVTDRCEKTVTMYLNLFMRCPGLLYATLNELPSTLIGWCCLGLINFNGIYYAKEAYNAYVKAISK